MRNLIGIIIGFLMMCSIIVIANIAHGAEFTFNPVENGYMCDEYTGRAILETLRTRRLQLEEKTKDYNELHDSMVDYMTKTNEKYATLEELVKNERSSWKTELFKAKSPGIGIFTGPAYGFINNKVDFVIGIGFVWKLW